METPKRKTQDENISFKVPASPFLKSLGYGTGVNVYCLERSPRSGQVLSPWAIKRVSNRIRVSSTNNSKILNDRIVKEAEILRKLNHPNIVGFRAVTQENGIDTLALECCQESLGLLLEHRLEQNLNALPSHHIKQIIRDISSALDYLHTDIKILHGDLKSHNILIKGSFEICKLCDFGVSLPLNEEGVVNFKENPHLEYVGTNLWCAPEIISGVDVIDSKVEIFSFGLIIYETITLVPPHTLHLYESAEELTSDDENNLYLTDSDETEDITLMEMAYGTRPALPQAFDLKEDYNIVVEVFYLCTNSSPDDRPSAKIIYQSLTSETNN